MFYAYKNGKNVVRASNEEQLRLLCEKLGIEEYIVSQVAPKRIELSPEQQRERIKQNLLREVDRYMDKTVQERGYDNIVKCSTYEGDIDPVFNLEGTSAKQWRSKVYRHLYNVLAQVESGEREIPTKEELLAELPKIGW